MPTWEPVSRVCRDILAQLPEFSRLVTATIRETVPVYLVVPEPQHRVAVADQLRRRLAALARRRSLREEDLTAAAELAAARAADGIPIDALIAAYQAGDREIWRSIVERDAPALTTLLAEVGSMVLAATSATTTVMARAHSRVSRTIDGGRITLAHQFLTLLEDPAERPAATLLAGRLGLDPNGPFVGLVCLPAPSSPGDPSEPVARLLTSGPDITARAAGDGRVEVLVQADHPDRLLAGPAAGGQWGIGRRGDGLAGAAESLNDARLALAATSTERPVVRFAEHWREALIFSRTERVSGLLHTAVQVARAQPHLATVVTAFAAANMSIAATAQAVHLHANSVTYRLGRWRTLSGLDPRTFDGLADSVIACQLARQNVVTTHP